MNTKLITDFCLEIDFKKDSEAPSRVFRAMSELLDTFQLFDRDLIKSINTKIEPVILLEDIETGSVKTWLRYRLEEIDDTEIKNLNWKPIVGKFLVSAKYLTIDFFKGKTEITEREQLEVLENNILQLAQQTGIKQIPYYTPVSRASLLQNMQKIVKATSCLGEEDTLYYKTKEETASFNLGFTIVPDKIEDLLTRETLETTGEMILKVKKPDYLGDSMWEFKHDNKNITVKIIDKNWLNDFQGRKIDVRPGDSIRAIVTSATKYGFDNNVVSTHLDIVEVIEVIASTIRIQQTL